MLKPEKIWIKKCSWPSAAGKPIFGIVQRETADMIRQYDLGISADSDQDFIKDWDGFRILIEDKLDAAGTMERQCIPSFRHSFRTGKRNSRIQRDIVGIA